MAKNNELLYVVRLTAEGQPEIVEATEELENHDSAVQGVRTGLEGMSKDYSNVNQLTAKARENFKENSTEIKKLASDKEVLSTAEKNLEFIMQDAGQRLQENTFHLESARMEYEDGTMSQEQYTARLRELKAEVEGIDAPSVQLIRRQREINRELKTMNPEVQSTQRGFSSTNSALFSTASALARVNPALGTTAISALSVGRSLGQITSQTGSADNALRQMATFALSPAGLVSMLALAATGVALLINHYDSLEEKTIDMEKASKDFSSGLDDIVKNLQKVRDAEKGVFNTEDLKERLDFQKEAVNQLETELELKKNQIRQQQEFLRQSDQRGVKTQRIRDLELEISRTEDLIESSKETILSLETEIWGVNRLRNIEVARNAENERLIEKGRKEAAEWMKEYQIEMAEQILKSRQAAEERVLKTIEDQSEAARQAARDRVEYQKMLNSMPELEGEELDESASINRALTSQRLIENARLAMIRDSVSERKFIEMQMEQEFERERIELIRQGITDEESLNALRILQRQQLNDELAAIDYELAEERKRIENEISNDRIAVNMIAADAIQVINENLLGGSRELSVLAFGIQRALAIKQMLVDSEARATQAQAQGHLFAANPATALLAANAFAQAAAIRANAARSAALMGAMTLAEGAGMLKGGSGGGGNGTNRTGFRSSNVDRNNDSDYNIVQQTGQNSNRQSGNRKNDEQTTIHLHVENRLDKEGLAMHVKDGMDELNNRNFVVISNG